MESLLNKVWKWPNIILMPHAVFSMNYRDEEGGCQEKGTTEKGTSANTDGVKY